MVYTALTNRTPVEMTCAEYLEKKPTGKWVKLKDCTLFREEVMTRRSATKQRTTEVFIPVRPVGSKKNGPVAILFASKNPEEIALSEEIATILSKDLKALPEDEHRKALFFLIDHASKIREDREIEGIIRFGLDDLKDKQRNKMADLDPNLTADFIVIEDGQRPDAMGGLAFLGVGVVFLGLRIFLQNRRDKRALRSGPPEPPPIPN